jgi:hypothetical protein
MAGNCVYVDSWDNRPAVHESVLRRARKAHKCGECGDKTP